MVAVCELSGHILCYDDKRYADMDDDGAVAAALRAATVAVKDKVAPDVKKMFSPGPGK